MLQPIDTKTDQPGSVAMDHPVPVLNAICFVIPALAMYGYFGLAWAMDQAKGTKGVVGDALIFAGHLALVLGLLAPIICYLRNRSQRNRSACLWFWSGWAFLMIPLVLSQFGCRLRTGFSVQADYQVQSK